MRLSSLQVVCDVCGKSVGPLAPPAFAAATIGWTHCARQLSSELQETDWCPSCFERVVDALAVAKAKAPS